MILFHINNNWRAIFFFFSDRGISCFHSDHSLHLLSVFIVAVLYCILPFLVLLYKFLGSSDYRHLNTVIVFWSAELLSLRLILLSVFAPQAVAVYALYKWVLFKKLSFLMLLVNVWIIFYVWKIFSIFSRYIEVIEKVFCVDPSVREEN
jgi:hypothetical protein